jgi:hypothetical protein
MKKTGFLRLIFVCLLVASVVIFTKAVYDNDDCAFDMLCSPTLSSRFEELFAHIFSSTGIFYAHHERAASPITKKEGER